MMARTLSSIVFIFAIAQISFLTAYSPPFGIEKVQRSGIDNADRVQDETTCSRRWFVGAGAGAIFSLVASANAFDNRLDDKYANAVQTPGKQPEDLGYAQRSNYVGLKECANSPNCWTSSAPKTSNPARWLPAWESNGRSIDDVKKIIDSYQVGHDNIDGGGFEIAKFENSNSNQYLYVRFQSYKAGYIDDFECWLNPETKKFDVRSSSRVGYSDLGVNALRLEYIAGRLEKEYGWSFERRKNGKLV